MNIYLFILFYNRYQIIYLRRKCNQNLRTRIVYKANLRNSISKYQYHAIKLFYALFLNKNRQFNLFKKLNKYLMN